MKTKLDSSYKAPEFDTKIADWLSTFKNDMWGGPPRTFGIGIEVEGVKVVYRVIEASGMQEAMPLIQFLHSIGLQDSRARVRGLDGVFVMP
ncbi:hypothetical protein ACO0K0_01590 [Undibacterium sp. SXout11W]|uniref:hypothetical protein n=1 Tax=Undibacterium sp. SXout11W TaxID=3413050 RepID=UPI003BF38C5D